MSSLQWIRLSTSAQFGYDSDGRRVSTTFDGITRQHVWDETSAYGDVILDLDGNVRRSTATRSPETGSLRRPTRTTPLPTATPTPFSRLDVQIIRVTTSEGQITTRFRLFNGGDLPLTITREDVWLVLGYGENPSGPHLPAEGLTRFDLLPGQAADMTLVWLWSGEPYAGFGVGDQRYSLQF